MTDEERVKHIEEAIFLMKDLVLRHEDRLDGHEERIDGHDEKLERFLFALGEERQLREEANKDFNFKLNVLIDAQIRNEAGIEKLNNASQAQLKRIENLEDK